jgi:hypothetical protein
MMLRLERKGDLVKLATAFKFNKKGRTKTIGIWFSIILVKCKSALTFLNIIFKDKKVRPYLISHSSKFIVVQLTL